MLLKHVSYDTDKHESVFDAADPAIALCTCCRANLGYAALTVQVCWMVPQLLAGFALPLPTALKSQLCRHRSTLPAAAYIEEVDAHSAVPTQHDSARLIALCWAASSGVPSFRLHFHIIQALELPQARLPSYVWSDAASSQSQCKIRWQTCMQIIV